MEPKIARESASIVVRGNFNPPIFNPTWLADRKLISGADAENADIHAISNDVASFGTEVASIEVIRDRFQATSTDARNYPHLCDLVVGAFTILEHTPVQAMGLNRRMHWELGSAEECHKLGDVLAPKDIWDEVLSHEAETLPRAKTGLLSMSIRGNRPNAPSTELNVTVAPSFQVENAVLVTTNEHYVAGEATSKDLVAILQSEWAKAQEFAVTVVEEILQRVGAA